MQMSGWFPRRFFLLSSKKYHMMRVDMENLTELRIGGGDAGGRDGEHVEYGKQNMVLRGLQG